VPANSLPEKTRRRLCNHYKGTTMNRFQTKPHALLLATILSALLAASGVASAGAASQVQAPVKLGSAGTFALLSKTGITNVYASVITGDVGASPITGAAIGLRCGEIAAGILYTVDAAGPLPCSVTAATLLTSAVSDMEMAYTDAAGRVRPDFTELGSGEIGGKTLAPGLYKWGTDVRISTDVTLAGGPKDVWIFQVASGRPAQPASRLLAARWPKTSSGSRPARCRSAPPPILKASCWPRRWSP
jgi:hypothetical protein